MQLEEILGAAVAASNFDDVDVAALPSPDVPHSSPEAPMPSSKRRSTTSESPSPPDMRCSTVVPSLDDKVIRGRYDSCGSRSDASEDLASCDPLNDASDELSLFNIEDESLVITSQQALAMFETYSDDVSSNSTGVNKPSSVLTAPRDLARDNAAVVRTAYPLEMKTRACNDQIMDGIDDIINDAGEDVPAACGEIEIQTTDDVLEFDHQTIDVTEADESPTAIEPSENKIQSREVESDATNSHELNTNSKSNITLQIEERYECSRISHHSNRHITNDVTETEHRMEALTHFADMLPSDIFSEAIETINVFSDEKTHNLNSDLSNSNTALPGKTDLFSSGLRDTSTVMITPVATYDANNSATYKFNQSSYPPNDYKDKAMAGNYCDSTTNKTLTSGDGDKHKQPEPEYTSLTPVSSSTANNPLLDDSFNVLGGLEPPAGATIDATLDENGQFLVQVIAPGLNLSIPNQFLNKIVCDGDTAAEANQSNACRPLENLPKQIRTIEEPSKKKRITSTKKVKEKQNTAKRKGEDIRNSEITSFNKRNKSDMGDVSVSSQEFQHFKKWEKLKRKLKRKKSKMKLMRQLGSINPTSNPSFSTQLQSSYYAKTYPNVNYNKPYASQPCVPSNNHCMNLDYQTFFPRASPLPGAYQQFTKNIYQEYNNFADPSTLSIEDMLNSNHVGPAISEGDHFNSRYHHHNNYMNSGKINDLNQSYRECNEYFPDSRDADEEAEEMPIIMSPEEYHEKLQQDGKHAVGATSNAELVHTDTDGESLKVQLVYLVYPSKNKNKNGKRNNIPDQTDAWPNVRHRSTPPITTPSPLLYPPYPGQPDYHTLHSDHGYNQVSRYPPAQEEAPPPLSARDKTISWLTSSEHPPTELPESADGRDSKVDSYRSLEMSHWTSRDVAHFLIEAIYDLGISYEDADFSQLSNVDGQRLLAMTPRHLDHFVHDEGARLHDYVRRHHNHEMITDSSYSVSNEVCEQDALHTPPPHHMASTTSPMHSNMHPGYSTISHSPSMDPSMSYNRSLKRQTEGLHSPPQLQGDFRHDMHQQKPEHYPHTTGMTTYGSGIMTHSGTLSYSSAMHSHGAEMRGHHQRLACNFQGIQSQSQEISRHSTDMPAHTTGPSLVAGLAVHPATMPSLSPALQSFPSLMSAHPSPLLTTPSPHLQPSASPGGYIPQAEPFSLQLPLTCNHDMGKPFPRLSETMMFSSAGELENIGAASSQQAWQAKGAPKAYSNLSDKDESSDDDDDDDDDDEEEEEEVEEKPPEPPKKRGPGRPPKPENERKKKKKTGRLWEFIRNLLLNPETCPSIVRWEDPENGVFRFVQSEKVAEKWGMRKNNEKMNYEKLSRAMRYYYKGKVFEPVLGRRLVYKFGVNAKGWKPNNANFENLH